MKNSLFILIFEVDFDVAWKDANAPIVSQFLYPKKCFNINLIGCFRIPL